MSRRVTAFHTRAFVARPDGREQVDVAAKGFCNPWEAGAALKPALLRPTCRKRLHDAGLSKRRIFLELL
jgi:hypothetical protein